MKKAVLILLLILAVTVPAFAKKEGSFDVVGKIGGTINPVVIADGTPADFSCPQESALSIAVEGCYYVLPELPIGVGINYQMNSELKETLMNTKCENGATNVYLTIKPTSSIDSKIFTGLYAIGQIGYGLNRLDGDGYSLTEIESDGLYWGLGAGIEIKNNFIFEFVFSTNYYTLKQPDYTEVIDGVSHTYYFTTDMKKTTLTLFIGYKFNV